MDVVVLGTGSADGWPNPFCTCASCTAERDDGRWRGQTSALVDGRLLLDCGPETPRAADRAGLDLSRLRHVLITHRHPDHCSPAFLLFRSWVSHGEPLDVVGPAEVIEDCRRWVAPDSPVRFTEVVAGDRLRLGDYDVSVLAARHGHEGSTVLYDVTAGGRLLYATDTAALPDETLEAVRGADFDVVLLEETFGDHAGNYKGDHAGNYKGDHAGTPTGHGTDHLDLRSFPEQLRRLREVGAVTPRTDVVAVHLSHHNPPTAELSRRLADWGARVVEDGTRLDDGHRRAGAPRRTLVVGGARSGKSREAERLLAAERDVTYVATAYPVGRDPEWDERVRRHQVDRPALWHTVESLDLVGLLGDDGGPLLVDCLTLWLTRVMDRHEAWDEEVWATRAAKAVGAEVDALAAAWRNTARRVVAVTNEVGQGVVPDTTSGRRFRDQMGRLNARLAAETEDVRWCVAGRVLCL